jgi:SagB-type dehydrogenase family enzyme
MAAVESTSTHKTASEGEGTGSNTKGPGPRFDPPIRPRFVQELVMVPLEGGVLFHGSDQLHTFEGKRTQSFLSTLLPLMDGTRDLGALRAALPGIPGRELEQAIVSLFEWGLVEEGAVECLPNVNVETLAHFRRYGGATGATRSGAQAYEAFAETEVVIFHAPECSAQARTLKDLLQMTGVEKVTSFHQESLGSWQSSVNATSRKPLMVSVSAGTEDYEWQRKVDDWCFERRLSWLRIVLAFEEHYADVGPLFGGQRHACYQCFYATHGRSHQRGDLNNLNNDIDEHFLLSIAATEIVYLLSKIGFVFTEREFQRYEYPSWEQKSLRCTRLPGCPRCRGVGAATETRSQSQTDGRTFTALVFEDYLALASSPVSSPKIESELSKLSAALSRETTRLSTCTQHLLDKSTQTLDVNVIEVLRDHAIDAKRPLTVHDLATIFMLTVGIRESSAAKVQRWTATAGNIGSVELYAAVCDIDGLLPGLYFYQPFEHSLALFKTHRESTVTQFVSRAAPNCKPESLCALVVMTGVFGRLARKYGEFGYRLLNLDAGVALSQFQLIARTLGFKTRAALCWPDDLIEQELNLETPQEQVTAVLALSKDGDTNTLSTGSKRWQCSPGLSSLTGSAADFFELSTQDVFEKLYRESRVREDDLRVGPFAADDIPEAERPGGGSTDKLRLPLPLRAGRTVEDILKTRTSVRLYTEEAISMEQLSTMLEYSGQGYEPGQGRDSERNLLTLLVIASRIDGLRPGIYPYCRHDHTLLERAADLTDTTELFVQPEFAKAPLVIYIVGNLAAACSEHGAFGHRLLLLQAGEVAHRLWTAALGVGLSGTVVAGLVAGAARQQLGLDGYNQASLVAFAAGYSVK